jgi:ZIP family zinc transporter
MIIMSMDPLIIILILTVAGPIIGAALGVIKKPSEEIFKNMLSFAAGVMLAISFLQLIPESLGLSSMLACCLAIAAGALLMYFVDKIIPHLHHTSYGHNYRIEKIAFFILVGMLIHNIPEGMAIAMGGALDVSFSIAIALAIAIHHIPESICTAAPYYYATKKRMRSFLLSASTAVPTLAGFVVSYYLLPGIPLGVVGLFMAFTAGLMIYISADELIPLSCGNHKKRFSHSTIFSLIFGVLFVIIVNSFLAA